ncbi:hypothetical protein [Brachyspira hampsonii]|uniref:hypothetical protein n=1 Tax=Brachyspira hampsonii TaxID=1287055 RepID=UPI0026C71355
MKFIAALFIIIIFNISCSDNSNNINNTASENILDYVQVDSPNSFIPLGISISAPEHAQNSKYFIVNKNIAESAFDYMNNAYIYIEFQKIKRHYYIFTEIIKMMKIKIS